MIGSRLLARAAPFLVAAPLLLPTGVAAQPMSDVEVLRLDDVLVDELDSRVLVLLRAEAADGRPVDDLRKIDLVVTEDGELVERDTIELSPAQSSSLPMAAVLALDVSRTMKGEPFDRAKAETLEILQAFQARGDSVAIVSFGGSVEVVADFSVPPKEVERRVEGLTISGKDFTTALYDGLYESLQLLQDEALPRRRFALVFSDGKDNGSLRSLDEVIALGEATETSPPIPVLAVGFSRLEQEFGALETLARRTHGRFVQVESVYRLSGSFRDAVDTINKSYVVRFPTSMDGESHTIEVAVEGQRASRTVQYARSAFRWLPWVIGLSVLVVLVAVLGVLVLRRAVGTLELTDGPESGRLVPVRRGGVVIGRGADSDIVLASPAVSSRHAEVRVRGRQLEIEDFGSTNGTRVNGEAVAVATLRPGDRIEIADRTLVLRR